MHACNQIAEDEEQKDQQYKNDKRSNVCSEPPRADHTYTDYSRNIADTSSDGQEALNDIEKQRHSAERRGGAPFSHEPDNSSDRGKARLAVAMCRRGRKDPEAKC